MVDEKCIVQKTWSMACRTFTLLSFFLRGRTALCSLGFDAECWWDCECRDFWVREGWWDYLLDSLNDKFGVASAACKVQIRLDSDLSKGWHVCRCHRRCLIHFVPLEDLKIKKERGKRKLVCERLQFPQALALCLSSHRHLPSSPTSFRFIRCNKLNHRETQKLSVSLYD